MSTLKADISHFIQVRAKKRNEIEKGNAALVTNIRHRPMAASMGSLIGRASSLSYSLPPPPSYLISINSFLGPSPKEELINNMKKRSSTPSPLASLFKLLSSRLGNSWKRSVWDEGNAQEVSSAHLRSSWSQSERGPGKKVMRRQGWRRMLSVCKRFDSTVAARALVKQGRTHLRIWKLRELN